MHLCVFGLDLINFILRRLTPAVLESVSSQIQPVDDKMHFIFFPSLKSCFFIFKSHSVFLIYPCPHAAWQEVGAV